MTDVNLDSIANLLANPSPVSETAVTEEADFEDIHEGAESEESDNEDCDCGDECTDCKCKDRESDEEAGVAENREYKNPITEDYIIDKNNNHGGDPYKWPEQCAVLNDIKIL